MSNDAPVGAKRGLLLISAAKLWFMIAGYAIEFGLPHALSTTSFGLWKVFMSFISPVNNVLVTGTIQGVSKFVSERDGRRGAVVRSALRLQAVVGGIVALAFVVGAPFAADALHDPQLTTPLRIGAGVILCYSFYAVFVGAANGARAFQKQALLDITFSTLRAGFVVAAAVLTRSPTLCVAAFVVAAATILGGSTVVVGVGPAPTTVEDRLPAATLWRFFAGVAVYLLIVNLLMFVDGLVLKRLVHEAAERAGLANPADVANVREAYYGAAQALSRLPYQLILAVTFVIFPLVSRATFDKDLDKTRGYVRTTMRYSLLAVALMASSIAARPEAAVRLLYKAEYAVAGPALALLAVGYACFALFNIACTIINGAGKPMASVVIGALTLAGAAGGTWIAIGRALAGSAPDGTASLVAAAGATAGAMAFGLVASALYLLREFGAVVAPLSILRVGVCVAAALAVGRVWPSTGFLGGKLGTLVQMACSAIAFTVVAIGSGELRLADLRRR
jgi:stage V sporulation protein B